MSAGSGFGAALGGSFESTRKNRIACGFFSSRIEKSAEVRSETGLPFLSLTTTLSQTSRVVACTAGACGVCGDDCADDRVDGCDTCCWSGALAGKEGIASTPANVRDNASMAPHALEIARTQLRFVP